MSTRDTNSSGAQPETAVESGVLAALPRTRPQRASPRRAAARTRAEKTKPETAGAKTSKTTSPKPARKATRPKAKPKTGKARATEAKPTPSTAKVASSKTRPTPTNKPVEPPAPKQGYEPEEEVELGKTVSPPSGMELVESVADIFGELANSSLAAGGRLLKDAFSLLRRP